LIKPSRDASHFLLESYDGGIRALSELHVI
jgi:hypothetical protein